ncbi:hypothetical protein ACRB8A_19665 (plasmid) [Arthrobacter sp. G.S.26]|uniref:hypothetical protein n=1 Tax=Arthrobacter sp. G.S.26 TaxID=3433706 RepID=UPI003D770A57
MKKKLVIRTLATMAVGMLLLTSGTFPANAVDKNVGSDSCSAADVGAGACVTAVVTGGEDPVVAGVVQQLQMGVPVISVEKFVQRRGEVKSDAAQVNIQEIVETYKKAPSAEAKRDALKIGQPVQRNPGGVGTVVGTTLDVKDTITYEYCSSSTGICKPSGTVNVEWRMSTTGKMRFALSGDIDVTSGSAIRITTMYCYTTHDGFLNVDDIVHNWENCPNAKTTNEVMYRQILSASWTGGTKNEVYHPTYVLAFKNFAATFQKVWDGREYKIASDGTTSWS